LSVSVQTLKVNMRLTPLTDAVDAVIAVFVGSFVAEAEASFAEAEAVAAAELCDAVTEAAAEAVAFELKPTGCALKPHGCAAAVTLSP
jgi:hypothetical protein